MPLLNIIGIAGLVWCAFYVYVLTYTKNIGEALVFPIIPAVFAALASL